MFRKKQKVLCYVIIFDQLEIIKQSLNFLTQYANDLEIVVIENPSPNSKLIKKYIAELGAKQLIKRYYLMKENIAGNAYTMVLEAERRHAESSPYVILTDGDLVSQDKNWLNEERSVLRKHPDVFACGVTLGLSNLPLKAFPGAREEWIPNDAHIYKDYVEVITGGHLLMMRGTELIEFLDWKNDNNLNFVDGIMHDYCYNQLGQKWARTKVAKAYHLTWDLYSNPNHPYTKLKTSKSFKETWHNNKRSEFSLVTY
jgi:hypothetical protein